MRFRDSDIYSSSLELKYSTWSTSDASTALIIYLFSIASFTKESRPYSRAIIRDFLMYDKIKIKGDFSDSDFFVNIVKLSVNMGIFPISAIQILSFYLYDIKTQDVSVRYGDNPTGKVLGLIPYKGNVFGLTYDISKPREINITKMLSILKMLGTLRNLGLNLACALTGAYTALH